MTALSPYEIIAVVTLGVVAVIILPLARAALHATCRRISARTRNTLDDDLAEFLPWPAMWIGEVVVAGALFFILRKFLEKETEKLVFYGLILLMLFALMWFAWRLGDTCRRRCSAQQETISTLNPPEGRDDFGVAAALVSRLFKAVLMGFAVLVVLSVMGIPASPLIAALSVAMLSLGLAVQPAAESVVGTVTMLATRPYSVGDLVVINEIEGFVQSIDTFSTVLRGWDGVMHTLPNSILLRTGVANDWRRHFSLMKYAIELSVSTPEEWEAASAFLDAARHYIATNESVQPCDGRQMVFLKNLCGYSVAVQFYYYLRDGPLSERSPHDPPTVEYWGRVKQRHSEMLSDILSLAHEAEVTFYERKWPLLSTE